MKLSSSFHSFAPLHYLPWSNCRLVPSPCTSPLWGRCGVLANTMTSLCTAQMSTTLLKKGEKKIPRRVYRWGRAFLQVCCESSEATSETSAAKKPAELQIQFSSASPLMLGGVQQVSVPRESFHIAFIRDVQPIRVKTVFLLCVPAPFPQNLLGKKLPTSLHLCCLLTLKAGRNREVTGYFLCHVCG